MLTQEVKARPHRPRTTEVARARQFLHGHELPMEEVLQLAQRLHAEHTNYSRRLLARALKMPLTDTAPALRLEVVREYARACADDSTMRAHHTLTQALELLEDVDDLTKTADAETLSSAASLHVRMWELDAQKHHVVRALAFYQRAFEHGTGAQQVYAGVHVAFLLDVLGHSENREAAGAGAESAGANTRQQQALQIRERLVETVPHLLEAAANHHLERDWHFLLAVAEVYFGLGRFDEARVWLEKAAALPISGRAVEAAARHLSMLARLQDLPAGTTIEQSPAWQCLRVLLGDDVAGLPAAVLGKVGLALSGGGFRAALFHVGVLARLAELDVLRTVEVISCVSGGSIVGAHYYLEVRKLLQEKTDAEITREDYIAIVERLEKNLLAGIQKNIRMLVAADGLAILRVIFDRDYSRTVRAGELYEREIYALVDDDQERRLRLLKIAPQGAPPRFHPRHDNWRRRAKVPVLILNATTLNTGHNWQFTTTWMGEPPSGIPREVDSNARLRRLYYHQAPLPHADIRIGKGVTASACVPGIFEPVTLSGLYPKHVVRLVDGGVHDNQGIGGLLDEHCKVVLVSDASGQMETLYDPGTNVFTVLSRSDNIGRVHIRAAEYDGLVTRCRTALLHNLMFLHLKKDLDVEQVNWIGCPDPPQSALETGADGQASYGILKNVQRRLAAVRTDLDTFCDQEAYALMLSGYRMTTHEFPRTVQGFPQDAQRADWRFLAMEPALVHKAEPHYGDLHRILDVARFVSFKIWRLTPGLLAVLLLLAGLLPAGFWLTARENGYLEGTWPAIAVAAAFVACYAAARIMMPWRSSIPAPLPGIVGLLLYSTMLLVLVEILWYTRLLWTWGTGFAVGTGFLSWVLAAFSAFAGLFAVLVGLFVVVYLLTVLLRAKKSWSEVAIGLGFIFFLPLANLHLLTYDRWYLWHGRLRETAKTTARMKQGR